MVNEADSSVHSGCTPAQLSLGLLKRSRHRSLLQDSSGAWTGAAALDCIATVQFHLERNGCRQGSRVAILSGNRPETWFVGVAAQGLGANLTWLHPLGTIAAHIHQIEDFDPALVIVDVSRYLPAAEEIAARFAGRISLLPLGGSNFGTDVLDAGCAGSRSAVDRSQPDALGQVNYTGGTTGRSKGAWRTNAALAASAVAILADFEFPRSPNFLAIGPISHVTGAKILPSLMRGGRVVMLDRYDPELVCSTIARERIDTCLLVPTMIYGLLDSPAIDRHDLSSLELLLYGASAMSGSRLQEALDRFGPVFSQLYGQTECYPIAVLPREDHDPTDLARLTACGFASNSCSISLQDSAGNEVAAGEAGEICVRAPYVMGGYWNQPELTASTLAGGWLHTGDVGRFDEDGRLYIVDRIKDLIISGGFNVYPREVEDCLTAIDGVAMAAVFGVPDSKWGEAVVATIVATPGTALDTNSFKAAVRQACGPINSPKHIQVLPQLPLTAAGKIDKKALREAFCSAQGNPAA